MLNWKDRDGYKQATRTLNTDQWKWEFLRRDPAYQEAWDSRKGKTKVYETSASQFDLEVFIDPKISASQLKVPIKFIRRAGYQLKDFKCSISKYFSKEEGEELDKDLFTTHERPHKKHKTVCGYLY